jgi:riboflavin synthase
MFTGIVEEIGVVKEASDDRLAVKARKVLEEIKVGDSIAVNGVCLTVVSLENHDFSVNVMPETLRRTNLGGLHYNNQVNLERALVVGGRLGGHFVSGHVDDTGEVMDVTSEETARIIRISTPAKLRPYIMNKGFITVDGVSLTVVGLDDSSFVVSLVAYTMEHTTLGGKRPGDIVNLEADVIAKYVEGLKEQKRQSLNLEFLGEYGFIRGTHDAIDAG